MKRIFLCALITLSLYSSLHSDFFQSSLWKPEQAHIINFVKEKSNPATVFEVGMDFGCVILCAEAFKGKMVQSVGIKKGYWELSKSLGRKVNFSRMDSRVLHIGKKPKYGLVVLNGVFEHRFMDLSFAFKHSRNIVLTSCNDKNVSKYLKQFLDKNKHVKVVREWPDCNGTVFLMQ